MAFKSKTLFVVGAGASAEVDIPTGQELALDIANRVNMELDDFGRPKSGDKRILSALTINAVPGRTMTDINALNQAGRFISREMPNTPSIDEFIDTHDGDKNIELMGKLGIISAILEYEKRSKLQVSNPGPNQTLRPKKLFDTWLREFWLILHKGYKAANLDRIFDHVSFIVFNYDRCLEHYLFHILRSYYKKEANEAASLMENLNIHHPYGVVGKLPWQVKGAGVEFGGGSQYLNLLSLVDQIRTFKEHAVDEEAQARMTKLVQEASTIVFLGFAYHPQNLEILDCIPSPETKRILGTALHLSAPNREVAKSDLEKMYTSASGLSQVDLLDLKCHQLLGDFSEELRQR